MKKAGTLDLLYVTNRRERKITPPLRGSRRSRAFFAKADAVGGAFLWHVPPPIRLRAYALSSSTPPQGGSDFFSLVSCLNSQNRSTGLVQQALAGACFFIPPCQGGVGGVPVRGAATQYEAETAFSTATLLALLRRDLARICPHLPRPARPLFAVSCAPLGGTRPRRPGAAPRKERKGGFQMRARHAKKGNRRPATDRGGAAPLSPAGTRFSRPGNAPRSARSGRRVFPENTINIDKFTGYFDKFLNGENLASYCNQRISNKNLSAVDSNMAEKNSQARRICPHLG